MQISFLTGLCFGGVGLVVSGVIGALSLLRQTYKWAALSLILIILHPAWIIGVDSGDCGLGKRVYAAVATAILIAALFVQVFRPSISIRRFIAATGLFLWIAYLLHWIITHAPFDIQISLDDPSFREQLLKTLVLSGFYLFRVAVLVTLISIIGLLITASTAAIRRLGPKMGRM
jgi:hypothetical protein